MSKKMMIIIIIVAVLVLGVMGGGFFMLSQQINKIASRAGQPVVQQKIEKQSDAPGVMYSLKKFIVNIADPGQDRFLSVKMDLEVRNKAAAEKIDSQLPKVRDAILTILPTKRSEELQSIKGKNILRDEIIKKLNTLLNANLVENIYFTEFVIQ